MCSSHLRLQPVMHWQAVRCLAAGVDVVFDPVGGAPFTEALKTLKWGGQIAIIGFASGTIPKVCVFLAAKVLLCLMFCRSLTHVCASSPSADVTEMLALTYKASINNRSAVAEVH